ncbi:MAG: hypothetical protein HC892_04400 [Saprospiraceae bacterium]|nr:hypothetical protein [Saprospiraceae bacterium]
MKLKSTTKGTHIALVFLLLLAIFLGCEDHKVSTGAEGNPVFKTIAPSQLFFKNMRSIYYQSTEDRVNGINYYIFKQLDTVRSPFYPVIAENWLHDEAYILLRSTKNDAMPIRFVSLKDTVAWQLDSIEDRAANYQFLMTLNQRLLAQESIVWATSTGERISIFDNPLARKHFLTVLHDYLRLTNR